MHKLVVLYKTPKDPAHFKHYYEATHLPIARKMPNIKADRYSFAIQGIGGNAAPEGQAVVADVPNYATAEVVIMHYEVAK